MSEGREYRIRVKPVLPWLEHYDMPTGKRPDEMKDWVFVIGAPVERQDPRITCDTDTVWPVLEIENTKAYRYFGGKFVCRHQIQIGD